MRDFILRKIIFSPCILWEHFGIYCPGCGGTRAVKALLQGQVLKSLWYHPLVLYMAVVLGYFLVKKRVKNQHLYLGVAILIVNWILRNILLLRFGIEL